MAANDTVYALDAGNTSLKVALIQNAVLSEARRFSYAQLALAKEWLETRAKAPRIFCSVLSEDENEKLYAEIPQLLRIDASHPVRFKLNYTSPTLGIDRLCNAAYAHSNMRTLHAVVLDIGTCIKFDLVHREQGYMGGSIAPGIRLRYEALHAHTGKLPLLSNKSGTPLVGTSTELSLQSGVMNGMEAEIQGIIDRYSTQYPDLTFFMSGGDAGFFEFHSKNNIFADENLTLKGLFEIYRHNA
jgi:type III pantothenate kinase